MNQDAPESNPSLWKAIKLLSTKPRQQGGASRSMEMAASIEKHIGVPLLFNYGMQFGMRLLHGVAGPVIGWFQEDLHGLVQR